MCVVILWLCHYLESNIFIAVIKIFCLKGLRAVTAHEHRHKAQPHGSIVDGTKWLSSIAVTPLLNSSFVDKHTVHLLVFSMFAIAQ
uniref:Uncharacterized protein n=1 Tax=Anguilla anguilla TaxID=7936 RepID=A0A0E9WRI9_ANGAN